MAYEWGKHINGEVFIEDPIIINNGNIISTEELENKENFNIKQIKYEDFPGIEEGYWFSNYWEEFKNGKRKKSRQNLLEN